MYEMFRELLEKTSLRLSMKSGDFGHSGDLLGQEMVARVGGIGAVILTSHVQRGTAVELRNRRLRFSMTEVMLL